MLKKIKKIFKKIFKIKNKKKEKKKNEKKKLETIEEREITEEKIEDDLIEIRFVEEVLDELEFSSSLSSSTIPSDVSFYSVDEMNKLIDSIELP